MGEQREAHSIRAVHNMHSRQYIHFNRTLPHGFSTMVTRLLQRPPDSRLKYECVDTPGCLTVSIASPMRSAGKLQNGGLPLRNEASEYDAMSTNKDATLIPLSTSLVPSFRKDSSNLSRSGNIEDGDSTKTHTHHRKSHLETPSSPASSPVESPTKEAQKPGPFEQFQSFADQKSKFLSQIEEASRKGSSPEAPSPGTQPSPATEETILFPGKATFETEQESTTEERTPAPKKSPSFTPAISTTPETEPKVPRRCTGLIETRCCRWETTNCPCGSHPDGSFCVAVKMLDEKHLSYKIYSGWHIIGQCKCPSHFRL